MSNSKFDITGKVAIVTGGNGGLGLGIAKGLAIAGAKVAIAGRNQDKIDNAVKELKAQGADAIGVSCDVGVEDDVNRMVATTAEHFGRIDILFNNAAISWGIPTETMSLDEWNNFITNNLTSTFLTCKACFPHMVEAGGGKIINVGSIVTKLGYGKLSHYAAAKGGMDHMTQSLAQGWGRHNIQVNALLPGLVDSEMMPCTGPKKNKLVDYIVKKTPTGNYSVPEDWFGISILLASPASDFITGSIIVMDGGLSLVI
jgi:2-dehydro-3-deoxy-D-gluconate 5-dehydrogenase